MKKLLSGFLVLIMFLFLSPVTQAQAAGVNSHQDKNRTSIETAAPIIYSNTFTVTSKGGNFQVGFVKVSFKNNFMDGKLLPIKFTASIYAENGQSYIEFTPGISNFNKEVQIDVSAYKGYLYDKILGKNIHVNIKSVQFTVEHFSRYALCR
ncbi:MAG TPA: hypothetical protein VIK72_16415 [Clostridiaceae bacterium]